MRPLNPKSPHPFSGREMTLDETDHFFDDIELPAEVVVAKGHDMHAAVTMRPRSPAVESSSLAVNFTTALGDSPGILGYALQTREGVWTFDGDFDEARRDQVAYIVQLGAAIGAELGLERMTEMSVLGTTQRLTHLVGSRGETGHVLTVVAVPCPPAARALLK